MPKKAPKPPNCVIRRCQPRGTLSLCKGACKDFDDCVAFSRWERENPELSRHKYTDEYRGGEVGEPHVCPYCGKPIAKPTTKRHAYKGMLVMHVKAKHPEKLRELKQSFKEDPW